MLLSVATAVRLLSEMVGATPKEIKPSSFQQEASAREVLKRYSEWHSTYTTPCCIQRARKMTPVTPTLITSTATTTWRSAPLTFLGLHLSLAQGISHKRCTMSKVFLSKYKHKAMQQETMAQEHHTIKKKQAHSPIKAEASGTNLTPPMMSSPSLAVNPLHQLADISLNLGPLSGISNPTMNFGAQQHISNLFQALLQRQLAQLSAGSVQPPPTAHMSKVPSPADSCSESSSPPLAHITSSPPRSSCPAWAEKPQPELLSKDDPQDAPQDLRVMARKLEFLSAATQATNCSEDEDDSNEDERSSVGESSSHEAALALRGCFTCGECGKSYSTSSNLARHKQTHRSFHDKKARTCPHCHKVYVSMPAYSMHLRTHNQGCKCPHCGKCFSRPWLLQGHIRTHTGEKPFSCSICQKAFADKSNLRAHIQTHSETKPFVCSHCNKAFALKSYLYKHEESSCMKACKQHLPKRRSSGSRRLGESHPHHQLLMQALQTKPMANSQQQQQQQPTGDQQSLHHMEADEKKPSALPITLYSQPMDSNKVSNLAFRKVFAKDSLAQTLLTS